MWGREMFRWVGLVSVSIQGRGPESGLGSDSSLPMKTGPGNQHLWRTEDRAESFMAIASVTRAPWEEDIETFDLWQMSKKAGQSRGVQMGWRQKALLNALPASGPGWQTAPKGGSEPHSVLKRMGGGEAESWGQGTSQSPTEAHNLLFPL